MVDIYSTVQFLAIVACLAFLFDRPLRREGVIVVLMTWTASNISQLALSDLTPTGWYAAIDLIALIWFCWIAFEHSRIERVKWAWLGAGCYLVSLFIHVTQHLLEWPSQFLYISTLNGLVYFALFGIVFGPLVKVGAGIVGDGLARSDRSLHWGFGHSMDPPTSKVEK